MSIDEKAKNAKEYFHLVCKLNIFSKKAKYNMRLWHKKSLRINFKIHPEGQQEH